MRYPGCHHGHVTNPPRSPTLREKGACRLGLNTPQESIHPHPSPFFGGGVGCVRSGSNSRSRQGVLRNALEESMYLEKPCKSAALEARLLGGNLVPLRDRPEAQPDPAEKSFQRRWKLCCPSGLSSQTSRTPGCIRRSRSRRFGPRRERNGKTPPPCCSPDSFLVMDVRG